MVQPATLFVAVFKFTFSTIRLHRYFSGKKTYIVGVWVFTYSFILLIAKLETGLLYKLAGSCPRFFPSWCCPFFFFFVKNGEFIKNKIKKVTGDFQSLKPLLFPFSLQLELGDRCRNIEAQKNIPRWEFYLVGSLKFKNDPRVHPI